MNYIDEIAYQIEAKIGSEQDMKLMRIYAVLALTTGKATTLENVHDAWSAWRAETRPDHPSLVWFNQLTPEIQEYDRKYMNVIHRVADMIEDGIF